MTTERSAVGGRGDGEVEEPRAAVQLYSLRALDASLPELLSLVADAGFDGVEFGGRLREADPVAVRAALAETGLVPMGAHVDLDRLEGDREALLGRYERVGCRRVVIPHLPPARFVTRERVAETGRRLEALAAALDDRGFTLAVHTTWPMFGLPLDSVGLDRFVGAERAPDGAWPHLSRALGRVAGSETPLDVLAGVTETVRFQVDLGGVASAGVDLDDVFDSAGDRLDSVHVADVRRTRGFPPAFGPADIGSGAADIERGLARSLDRGVDWVVFEHDAPDDPVETLDRAARLWTDRGPDGGASR